MSYCLNPHCPHPENPREMQFCQSCGTKLLLKDRYRVLQPLGQGGFGKTFLAIDEDKPSKPPCVVKQFYPQVQSQHTLEKATQLFTQEAIRLDELGKHPQIPELLAFFTQDQQQYLVQEYIAGQDLQQELQRSGVFDESQIRALLQNLLPVLQFIHGNQIIHRDLKPDNIIFRREDRQLVLVDFGASKAISETTLNQTGTSIGSTGYAAPEQMIGRATLASDFYSLGVTCIHLLTGVHPFDLYDAYEADWRWRKHLQTPVSEALEQILAKMLAMAVSQRYQSATAILNDLNLSSPQTTDDLDQHLASLEAKFSQKNTSASSSIKPVAGDNQIDVALAEIQAQFGES
jgi:serine/threonine protein kinase